MAVRDPVVPSLLDDRRTAERSRQGGGELGIRKRRVEVLRSGFLSRERVRFKVRRCVALTERILSPSSVRGSRACRTWDWAKEETTHATLDQPPKLDHIGSQDGALVPLDDARVVLDEEQAVGVDHDVELVLAREAECDPCRELHVLGTAEAVVSKSFGKLAECVCFRVGRSE